MGQFSQKRIMVKLRRFFRKLKKADWSNPVNVLLLACALVLPFVAKIYVMSGLLLGLLLAMSIMWTVDHLPNSWKRIIQKFPIASDFILSTIALFGVGSLFGQGLVLALGAIFCGLIIGWCIPFIKMAPAM